MKVEIMYLSGFIDKSYNYANFVNFRVKTPSPTMSASPWDQSLASADGLLTNEECSMLLEIDLFGDDNGAFTNKYRMETLTDIHFNDSINS